MCSSCGADELAERIEDELAMKDFGKVRGFLESVLDFARENNHVTEDQRRGVENCLEPREEGSRRW